MIEEFEKIGKLPYEENMPKHEPTPIYFYLVRQLAKCMMRYDKLNRHDHGSYMEKTAPSSNDQSKFSKIQKGKVCHRKCQ